MLYQVKYLYKGKANALLYILLGFSVSIFLGLGALRISNILDELANYHVLEYSRRAVFYGVISSALGLCTLLFLITISIGIIRYFRSRKGTLRWALLVLAMLHAPISALTLLTYIGEVKRVFVAVIRYVIY